MTTKAKKKSTTHPVVQKLFRSLSPGWLIVMYGFLFDAATDGDRRFHTSLLAELHRRNILLLTGGKGTFGVNDEVLLSEGILGEVLSMLDGGGDAVGNPDDPSYLNSHFLEEILGVKWDAKKHDVVFVEGRGPKSA